jgi:hypothetical protein
MTVVSPCTTSLVDSGTNTDTEEQAPVAELVSEFAWREGF